MVQGNLRELTMPRYDYKCQACGREETHFSSYEEREHPRWCGCGELAHYRFPVEAALGFKPFEAMYCEPLDCDVHGRREWEQILKSEGLQEKALPAGQRNEEKSKYAVRVMPQAPVGRSYADLQRERARIAKLKPEIERAADIRTQGAE